MSDEQTLHTFLLLLGMFLGSLITKITAGD